MHSQRGGHRILKPPSYSQQQQISPVPLKELRTTMPPLAKKDSISSLHSTKTAINYNEWNLLEQEQKQNVLPLQQKQQKQNPSEERTSIHLRIKRMEDGNEVSLEGGNNQLSSNRYPSFKKAGGYDSTRRRINDPPRNNSTTMALKKDDLSNTPGESRAVPKLIASQIDVIKNHRIIFAYKFLYNGGNGFRLTLFFRSFSTHVSRFFYITCKYAFQNTPKNIITI